MINLSVLEAPSTTIVTVDELKANSRITDSAEDLFLASCLAAAQRVIEGRTDRALGEQKLRLVLDAWPEDGVIRVPRPPLKSVEFVKYVDAAGVVQTVTAGTYIVDGGGWPGIVHRIGSSWPSCASIPGAIRVDLTAGGVTGMPAPKEALQAVLLLATHWYENREPVNIGNIVNELPFAVEALITLARWQ